MPPLGAGPLHPVADALASGVMVPLGQGEEDVDGELAHGRLVGGVHLLGGGDDVDAVFPEVPDSLQPLENRAAYPARISKRP